MLMRKEYLKIAREAVALHFKDKVVDKEAFYRNFSELKEQGATFVTLTKKGELRGCIGSIVPHRDLLTDLIENAKSAAFKDPRFAPLNEDELQEIKIEVSLLSLPELVNYVDVNDLKSKIKVGKHGVIIKQAHQQATFLPQVWEQLPTFELFFSHLGNKAGLNSRYLESHPEVWTYEVNKIKED